MFCDHHRRQYLEILSCKKRFPEPKDEHYRPNPERESQKTQTRNEALIELFKSISVLGKWAKNQLFRD
jgi:hypothetical protein